MPNWVVKIGDAIYTYIGCGRFTLEEAKKAMYTKCESQKAEEYIKKVIERQEMVD